MAARLLSVNVGRPREVVWDGRLVHTGIWKFPVTGPVMARRLNLDGDGQGDLNGHGGEQRAVMVYQAESYQHWRRHLRRSDLAWGTFGENFTVDGLADDEVCIGDRYRIGEAEFEVTQPRTTCYRVGLRLDEPQMPSLLVAHHRPGFYLRVLHEGRVRAGDDIVKSRAGPRQISVASTDALLYLPDADVATMRLLLEVDALSPGWRGSFRDLVDQADQPPQQRRTPTAPAWEGFRPLRVSRLVRETDRVTSVYLAPMGGGAPSPGRPGQYLTVRLAAAGEPAPVRSYSLSGGTTDGYRISVQREPLGVMSRYIGTRLAVGEVVDVAAPRGDFVLEEGRGPVILLSAGIGVTPLLAMLHALAAERSTREIWWLHTTRDRTTHAMAEEARQLLAVLPAGRAQVFYTASGGNGATPTGATRGRLDEAVLAGLGLPSNASTYLCGPISFMDGMRAALTDLGLSANRLHTELFGSPLAINPGVVGVQRRVPHQPVHPGSGPMVTFARAGLSVAFDEEKLSLLEMAEACDVPTQWSCRTGVCHTCATGLLSGTVRYSPAPLTPPGISDVLLCCARPDADVVLDL
jgi:ferredoxin-NADP reductase/MOSC domain-containing protein YiiM